MILGDSLLVMNSLAEKEGLRGQVQMVYIDPPYGINFGSNWQVSTRRNKLTDKPEDATRQPEQVKAFRDTWSLGIHSYLAYLRDRLVVARELLVESCSIFVQIGDENVHLVRCVLDEVFGRENEVVTITVKKKGSQKSSLLDPVNDYLLWYSKTSRHGPDGNRIKFRRLFEKRKLDAVTLDEFRWVEIPGVGDFPLSAVPNDEGDVLDYRLKPSLVFNHYPEARLFRPWPITNGGERINQSVPFEFQGRRIDPPRGRCWSHTARGATESLTGMDRVKVANRLIAEGKALDFRRYLEDFPYKTQSNWWDGLGGASDQIYVVQTNVEIVKRCILMSTDPGDIVFDPTCGSGTTAYVAEQWGRRWITTDTSRVAITLARTRLTAARYPYFRIADSSAGGADIRRGFVYRTSAKITSGSIANNEEIDDIHARWQEELELLQAKLNELLGQAWQEWEIPGEAEEGWPDDVKDTLDEWWQLRQTPGRNRRLNRSQLRDRDPI